MKSQVRRILGQLAKHDVLTYSLPYETRYMARYDRQALRMRPRP